MLLNLYNKLQKRNPRFIYDWNDTIRDSRSVLEYTMNRYNNIPFLLNNITKQLKAMVLYIDVDYIKTLSSDVDIYLSYIEPLRFKIESYIKSSFPTKTNGVWVNNPSTCEIIIPIQSVNPLETLPMDQDYSSWENVKPLRILYHNSHELSYNINNTLQFNIFKPSVFITTLDITQFILKYIHYMTTNPNQGIVDEYVNRYVYKELYLPLIEDLFQIWVFNTIDKCVSATSENDIDLLCLGQMGKIIPPTVKIGIHSVYNNVQELVNGTITFEDFICTGYYDGKSLLNLIEFYINNIRTYNQIQYKHHEFLLELHLVKLLRKISLKKQEQVGKRAFDVTCERIIDNYIGNKMYNQFQHPLLRSYVENSLYEMRYV